jgi:hypothetical protein
MSTQARLIYCRPSDNIIANATTVTPSTEATGYDVENLWDGNPAKPWKATAQTANIVFDFGVATSIELVALIHHNLTAGLEVRIQGNATNVWSGPTLNQAFTIAAYDQDGFPVNPYLDLTAIAHSFRFWRLVIVGTNAANVAIGEMWLSATKRTLVKGVAAGFKHGASRPLIEHVTDYQVSTIYDLGAKVRSWDGRIMTTSADLLTLQAWWDACRGRALPTLLVPDPTVSEIALVRWRSMERSFERIYDKYNPVEVGWTEVSRGLVL